jgi:hypothetical protein
MLKTMSLVVIVSLALLGTVGTVGAGTTVPPTATPVPSNIFYWNRLDTDVTVLSAGDLRVVETWKLTFVKGLFKAGSRYFALQPGQTLRDVEVTVGGIALTEVQPKDRRTNTFSVTRLPDKPGPGQASQVNIDWAYWQTTSPNTMTFVVAYTAGGMLKLDPAADAMAWQGVWPRTLAPVRGARITVHLPPGAEALQVRSEGAPATSKIITAARPGEGATVVFTASDIIPPPDALTAHVAFTSGIVQPEAAEAASVRTPSAQGGEPGQFPTCGPGGCG